jgi:hypothetical protein
LLGLSGKGRQWQNRAEAGSQNRLHRKPVLPTDGCGGREINQLVSVFEYPQFQHVSDYLERLQSKQPG